jgi:hypothetical protein
MHLPGVRADASGGTSDPEHARELGISEERVIKEVMLKNTVDGESLNVTHGWHMD